MEEYHKYLKYKTKYLQLKQKIERRENNKDSNMIMPALSPLQQMRINTYENEQEGGFTLTTGYYAFFCNSKLFTDFKVGNPAPKLSDINTKLGYKAYSFKLFTKRTLDLGKLGTIGNKQGKKLNLVIPTSITESLNRYLQKVDVMDYSETDKKSFMERWALRAGMLMKGVTLGIPGLVFILTVPLFGDIRDYFRRRSGQYNPDTKKDIELAWDEYRFYKDLPDIKKKELEDNFYKLFFEGKKITKEQYKQKEIEKMKKRKEDKIKELQSKAMTDKERKEQEERDTTYYDKKIAEIDAADAQQLLDKAIYEFKIRSIKKENDDERRFNLSLPSIPVIKNLPQDTIVPSIESEEKVINSTTDAFVDKVLKFLNKQNFIDPTTVEQTIQNIKNKILMDRLLNLKGEQKTIKEAYDNLPREPQADGKRKLIYTEQEKKTIVVPYTEMKTKINEEIENEVVNMPTNEKDFYERIEENNYLDRQISEGTNIDKYNKENQIDCCVIIDINSASKNIYKRYYKLNKRKDDKGVEIVDVEII